MMENEVMDFGNLVCAAIKSFHAIALGRSQKPFSCVFDRSLSHNDTACFFKIITYVASAWEILNTSKCCPISHG